MHLAYLITASIMLPGLWGLFIAWFMSKAWPQRGPHSSDRTGRRPPVFDYHI